MNEKLEAGHMEYSMGHLLGALVGALLGLGLVALLFKLKVMDLTFDERQERARGQAYKYGFWTLLTRSRTCKIGRAHV